MVPRKNSLDGGWGWVIVLVSFLSQFLGYGSPLAVGVLYLEWLDVFGEGKGKTAWVGSLASGVGLLASPICSSFVSAFGARPVTIFSGFMVAGGLMMSSFAPNVYFLFGSYGIVVGLGCGLLYTATVTITCQYFDKRRGLALGLISTGSSVGLFIYAALQKALVEWYGLEWCLLITGALSLNILPCGSLMRPLQESHPPAAREPGPEAVPEQPFLLPASEMPREKDTLGNAIPEGRRDGWPDRLQSPQELEGYPKVVAEEADWWKQLAKKKWQRCLRYCEETLGLFKNRVFSALFVAIFLFDLGGFPPALLMEDVARSSQIITEDGSFPLISVIGLMTTLGKLALGILADWDRVNALYLYAWTLGMTAVALLLIPFAQSYVTLAMLSGALGFLAGNWSVFPHVTTQAVGIEKLAHAYGLLMFSAGLGNSLGPPAVGWLYDWSLAYDEAFYFSGLCVFSGGLVLLMAVLPCWGGTSAPPKAPLPETPLYKV